MIVSPEAIAHIKKHLSLRGRGVGIKLGLKKSGCSGFAYTISYIDSLKEIDISEKVEDFYIGYSKKDHQQLNAVQLDYKIDGLNEGLVINNLLESTKCGCGKSVGF